MRLSPDHFASAESRLFVFSSSDERAWSLETVVHLGVDLREPRFLSLGGRLFMYFAKLGIESAAFEPRGTLFIERKGAASWTTPADFRPGRKYIPWRFVVQGGRPARVLVRGRGPSLAAAGLTGVLANPVLELVSSAGRIAVNDDWMQWPQKPEVEAFVVGEPHESMICMTLPPGAYTAIMTGAGGDTGIGIIEVFLLD